MARKRGLSEYASLAMVILGLVTFLFVYVLAGIVLMALGVVMYLVYIRVGGKKPVPGPPAGRSDRTAIG